MVPFTTGASKELQKHVETKLRDDKQRRQYCKTLSTLEAGFAAQVISDDMFLKEVVEDFILPAMSFRFFVTPGSWTESSSPTEFSPDRMRSLSRSDQRASVEISYQKYF